MKAYISLLIAFASFSLSGFGQTDIQGNNVLPLQSVLSANVSSILTKIPISQAHTTLTNMQANKTKTNVNQFVGEWFVSSNGLLINIVTRNGTGEAPLEEAQEMTRGMHTDYLGEGENPFEADYYDVLKDVNNFKVLIYYFKSSQMRTFEVVSNDQKYELIGSIYCYSQDIPKAEAFMDTLLNSITFK